MKFSLKIKNFRSIRNIEINSSKQIISLIGLNDTGKTNIIDSITKIQTQNFNDNDFNYNKKRLIYSNEGTIECNIMIYFNKKNDIHSKFIEMLSNIYDNSGEWLKNNFPKFYESFFSIKNNHYFEMRILISFFKENEKIHTIVSNQSWDFLNTIYENLLDDKMANILIDCGWLTALDVDKIDNALKYGKYTNFLFKQLSKKRIDSKEIINLLEIYAFVKNNSLFDKPNIYCVKNSELTSISEKGINLNTEDPIEKSTLNKWLKILDIQPEKIIKEASIKGEKIDVFLEKKISCVNEKISNLCGEIGISNYKGQCSISNNVFTFFFDKKDILENENWYESFGVNTKSDGIKQLLSIILQIDSIDSNSPTIILLDEPEKHLNPLMHEKLFNFLIKQLSKRQNAYLIYSTHSSLLIDNLITSTHKNIVYRSKLTNETKTFSYFEEIIPNDIPSELTYSGSVDFAIDNFFGLDQLSKILNNTKIKVILVEGKSDKEFFEKMLLNKANDFFIITCRGGSYIKYCSIITEKLKFILNTRLYCIFDSDDDGERYCNLSKEVGINEEYITDLKQLIPQKDRSSYGHFELEDLKQYCNKNVENKNSFLSLLWNFLGC